LLAPRGSVLCLLIGLLCLPGLPTLTSADPSSTDSIEDVETAPSDEFKEASISGEVDSERWNDLELERNLNPGGSHRLAAVDAFLLGRKAWNEGRGAEARAYWIRSAELDLNYLPPRLQLVQVNLHSNFSIAMESLRECGEVFRRDFQVQRWVLSNSIIGLCLAITLAAIMFVIGLLIRHARALHHTVQETLSYALRIDRHKATFLAILVLLVPILANLGVMASALFFLFLSSYRFSRSERVLALTAATWGVIVGPMLIVTSPWWSIPPDGRDAVLVSQAQQDPTTPALRGRVADWIRDEPSGVSLYLEGLASKVDQDGMRAVDFHQRAGWSNEIPRWVLETNIGNALIQSGRREAGQAHYYRAIQLVDDAFEPHYNLALTQAREGRYLEADARFDRASRINLDQMRHLTARYGDRPELGEPIDALWSAADLWAWTLKNPGPVIAPMPIALFLPLRSLLWSAPIVLFALIFGLSAGRWLQRIVKVHECYQCGSPVCRRCLVRLDRRAYCPSCAEALGGMANGDATKLLLRRLLEERPVWTAQTARLLAPLLPGVGALVYAGPTLAFFTGGLSALGIALLLFPVWGHSVFWGPWPDPLISLIQLSGGICFLISVFLSYAGIRNGRRRAGTVKAFIERDVDRTAA